MALSSATITANLSDMLGTDFDTRRTKVWVSTNVPGDTVIDGVGNAIRLGTGTATLGADGALSLAVWIPGTGSNPATWQTSIHVDYPDPGTRSRKSRTFGPFTITASADLADLIEEQEVPPEYLTTVTTLLDGYVGSAAASAALAEDISGIVVDDDVVTTLINDSGSDTAAALAASTVALLEDGSADSIRLSSDTDALVILDTVGTNGRRLRIAPHDQATSTASAQLELVPGANVDPATECTTQILLYNKTGANYERLVFSCVNNQYVIDSTYNGTGASRNIYFQMGGTVTGPIASRNSLILVSDASVRLPGGSYAADGKTWHAERTTIIDDGNTGDCRLVMDTRTGTPASNTADDVVIELRRGGSKKWTVGLNWAGANADTFDFVTSASAVALQVRQDRNIGLGSGASALFSDGLGVVGIANATTVPGGSPSGGGILYVQAGALKYKGSSGTVTTLGAA